MIALFKPDTGPQELAAVEEVLASGWLGEGDRARGFERAMGEHIGRPASELVAVSSCTEGLFQVMAALDLGPDDEVVLPTVSFIGAAHAVRATGARVVTCDVDARTLNPTVEHIARVITPATRALLVIHYGGGPGDIEAIAALAEERSLTLVEDAACGLGSSVGGRACGTFGVAGVWSFDAAKLVTTGDGGMIWCRDEALAERIRSAIRMGVGSSGFARSSEAGRWWEIDPSSPGRRATMNDLAAALGLVQLGRLPAFLRRRREITDTYRAALDGTGWIDLPPPRSADEADMFFWVQVPPEVRDRLARHMLDRGIYTNFRYWPLHRTTLYRSEVPHPGADEAAARTLLLPAHQGLSDEDVASVIDAVLTFRGGQKGT
jgi:dTDP-4-amino-4,6-dideoxygalactose transaminase